jgi:phosphoribosylanthranilate isomerase
MVKVKICGITNLDDALAAIHFGADAVGFLVGQVHPSKSVFISAEAAARIAGELPPFCSTVLVTHMARPPEILRAATVARVTTIQLHGDTDPSEADDIRRLLPNVKVYKAVHVIGEAAISEAQDLVGKVDGIILDTAIKETGQVGGTGKPHDWRVSRAIVQSVELPVILAGGLTAKNVREAIQLVKPYAVDVNSGVSYPNGTKDYRRLKRFIEEAKLTSAEPADGLTRSPKARLG